MLRLLLLLACLSSPLSAVASCPLPNEVPSAQYPANSIRSGNLNQWNDGNDWFNCTSGYLLGQLGAASTPFTTKLPFRCNTTSKKWTYADSGFEAPPFLNCVQPPTGFLFCSSIHVQSDGERGDIIFLGGENINYCPNGTLAEYTWGGFADYVGTALSGISCYNLTDENRLYTWSACGNGIAWPEIGDHPKIKCVERQEIIAAYCFIKHKLANGTVTERVLYPGQEQICASTEFIERTTDNTLLETIDCSTTGLHATAVDGNAKNYVRCDPPQLKCVGNCVPKTKNANGTIGNMVLRPGKEQFCPKGSIPRFTYGAELIKDMKCDRTGLKITVEDGTVVTHQKTNPPTLECLPTCPIQNHLSNDTIEKLILFPGKEDYCPDGQTIRYANGSDVSRLTCSKDGLQIENAQGFSNFQDVPGPILKCGPGKNMIQNFVASCPIKFRYPNNTIINTFVETGGHALCPDGQGLKLSYGMHLITLLCEQSKLTLGGVDGGLLTYDKTRDPIPMFECATNCLVIHDPPQFISPGKEQFCPAGTVAGMDGRALQDIKCTDNGLVIVKEDGTVIEYPRMQGTNITCVTGECTRYCAAPTTTTTTTTVATTTTIPAYCPLDGVWSEWTVTGSCASTCGANSVATRNRTCTDKCGKNCPCIGPSEDVGPCGIALCPFPSTTCKAPFKKVLNYETNTFFCGEVNLEKVVCPLDTTTTTVRTTTVAPTTTTPKDVAPTAAQLWDVKYYYNVGRILHAFCADQACINVIQSNGIGYDTGSAYSGVVARAIREDAISAVRAACPTGSANLRNLGFTKVGNHYEYNLSGSGLKQGWVSIAYGACGATKGIKKWKCHMSEDVMYHTDLENNTYYKGLVQDGGNRTTDRNMIGLNEIPITGMNGCEGLGPAQ
ncbi:hypothetical protein PRIPAC_88952 [Pristionchus pacificus]|uniref:Uncharacterized protein n=1 Tax=Pristionchus pacificus TaxID=54126 RepID=A0A2A6B5R2_PRIPA|nr:hypothetical protein PRIPAC_88952 [Pristionchus pacificus]|eukprot:PDM61212.1 hypothetical protein PRIPAC_50654 [Pristionchus pacificus]